MLLVIVYRASSRGGVLLPPLRACSLAASVLTCVRGFGVPLSQAVVKVLLLHRVHGHEALQHLHGAALRAAVETNNAGMIRTVLAYSKAVLAEAPAGVEAVVNSQDSSGKTALIQAAYLGFFPIIKLLLKMATDGGYGVDLCAATRTEQNTALILAAYNGNVEIVRALVEYVSKLLHTLPVRASLC